MFYKSVIEKPVRVPVRIALPVTEFRLVLAGYREIDTASHYFE